MLELNKIHNMDCLDGLKLLDDNSIDSIVTDPPYELGFMGKKWDNTGISYNVELWKECLRVLKPGGYLLSFGGSRTYHRMACAIEDAGFEIRDQIMWIYSQGFPKSMDISKAIDKQFGAEREVIGKREHPTLKDKSKVDRQESTQYHASNSIKDEWDITAPSTDLAKQYSGYGTAIKPSHEPIVVARKPLSEKTVAKNVLKWGTGGINIDDSRIEFSKNDDTRIGKEYKHNAKAGLENGNHKDNASGQEQLLHNPQGRFPANIIFDEEAGKILDEQSGISKSTKGKPRTANINNQTRLNNSKDVQVNCEYNDSGGASRFFKNISYTEDDIECTFKYCAKASKKEKGEGNTHPTCKPLSLIKYLITLVTPPNGVCLDPFEGSGTTFIACRELGFDHIGFEMDENYCEIINKRLEKLHNKIAINNTINFEEDNKNGTSFSY